MKGGAPQFQEDMVIKFKNWKWGSLNSQTKECVCALEKSLETTVYVPKREKKIASSSKNNVKMAFVLYNPVFAPTSC